MPPELADALQRKQAADDAKFDQDVAMIEQKQQEQAARQQAEAERAANPSFIQRMFGAQPRPAASAPATPVVPPKPELSVAPKVVMVPTPKPAPALAAVAPVPVAKPAPVAAPMPAAAAAPAVGAAAAPAVGAAATADDGKIGPGETPEIQPVGKFVKKKFLWPDDFGPAEESGARPSG